jgi:NRPS condensation-like uncharacterized protein
LGDRINIGDVNTGFWYPLDNAAKIFPAITDDEVTSVFRISVYLKKPIIIQNLFKAVGIIEPRFPYYKVKLKKGFFWYYLESSDFKTPVEVDNQRICRKFNEGEGLFRVLVRKNRLTLEFCHILADGSGAFEYLKTLMATYFELCGVKLPDSFEYMKPGEIPCEEEYEDAYHRYFKENIPASIKQAKAFHLPIPLSPKPRFDVLTLMVSTEELKQKAKEKGVSITVYLTAVYFYVMQEIFESLPVSSWHRRHKKLSIEMPINLRNLYPSKTMRNFTLFVLPKMDLRLGHYSFDEMLKIVYHQMELETDVKLINKILSLNVGSERKLIIRSIPLFIKSFVLKLSYYSLGSSQYTGVLTNLGRVVYPKEIEDEIDYIVVSPPPPNKDIKINCGIIGFKDKLAISFGGITKTKELERRYVKFLVDQGIHVKLTTYNN